MSKKQIIDYWVKMAERDWVSVVMLLKGKQYMHALFFAHLVIEKILKAYWIKIMKIKIHQDLTILNLSIRKLTLS